MTEAEAIKATLECFPSTPGGAEAIRQLLAYQESHLSQLLPCTLSSIGLASIS